MSNKHFYIVIAICVVTALAVGAYLGNMTQSQIAALTTQNELLKTEIDLLKQQNVLLQPKKPPQSGLPFNDPICGNAAPDPMAGHKHGWVAAEPPAN